MLFARQRVWIANPQLASLLQSLYDQNLPDADIARAAKVSYTTVRRWRISLHLPRHCGLHKMHRWNVEEGRKNYQRVKTRYGAPPGRIAETRHRFASIDAGWREPLSRAQREVCEALLAGAIMARQIIAHVHTKTGRVLILQWVNRVLVGLVRLEVVLVDKSQKPYRYRLSPIARTKEPYVHVPEAETASGH